MGLKARKPTWKQRAVRALTASIAHWKRLRDRRERPGEGPYSDDCACCEEFFTEQPLGCGACPIAARTRRTGCEGTPFYAARETIESDSPARKAACQYEVDFLIQTRDLVRKGKVRAPEWK